MKRILAALLAACIILGLGGCAKQPTEPEPTPTPEPTVAPLATPAPTPLADEGNIVGEEAQQVMTGAIGGGETAERPADATPEPFSFIDEDSPEEDVPEPTPTPRPANDPYTYTSLQNDRLKVKFLYPEGWTSDPTTEIITMVEPVAEGEVPARFSITSMEYSYNDRDISTKRLKDHLSDYLKIMLDSYNEHQLGAAGYDRKFAQSSGIYAEYIAVKGNAFISGIVMVGYGKNGRVYCMHFCCEKDDFPAHADLIERLAENVSPIDD